MPKVDVRQLNVATFDKLADRYAEKYFGLDVYDRYLEKFASPIRQDASVLDVACGPGNASAYLAKYRPDLKLLGIDLAEGMLKQAKRRVPSAVFRLQDCCSIDGLGQRFDAAVFAFGLSYLTQEDANRFFITLNASLNDSASLYLSTITGEPNWSGIESNAGGDRVYQQYRSIDEVLAMVEAAGFRLEFQELIPSPANASKATQDLILIAQRT